MYAFDFSLAKDTSDLAPVANVTEAFAAEKHVDPFGDDIPELASYPLELTFNVSLNVLPSSEEISLTVGIELPQGAATTYYSIQLLPYSSSYVSFAGDTIFSMSPWSTSAVSFSNTTLQSWFLLTVRITPAGGRRGSDTSMQCPHLTISLCKELTVLRTRMHNSSHTTQMTRARCTRSPRSWTPTKSASRRPF